MPVLSNVTGDFYPIGPAAPAHIRDLLGKQFAAPVEWVKSLRRLHSEGIRIFVECGPKRVLTNLTLDTLPRAEVLALASNHPKKGGIGQLMETLAALAAGLLLIPGIGLTVLGRRRVALLGKVGGAVIAAARQTGRVTIADIAAQTQTSPDDVRTVVAMLTKRGAIPRDVEVS